MPRSHLAPSHLARKNGRLGFSGKYPIPQPAPNYGGYTHHPCPQKKKAAWLWHRRQTLQAWRSKDLHGVI